MNSHKKILVLMATFNGEKWLQEQIKSIVDQKNVSVDILVRDDGSEDSTIKVIKKNQKLHNIKLILNKNKNKNKSATLNFLNLIINAKNNYDFYAFSDQDDEWGRDKLIRAIQLIKKNQSEAYSSNIIIKKNGKKVLMNKSNNQKKYDYIFESVPGHTIVLTKTAFLKVKRKIIAFNKHQLNMIDWHDRFIYFFLRSIQIPWYIDKSSLVIYRQHENNVFGVNYGFGLSQAKLKAMKKRLLIVISGYYRNSILNLAKLTNLDNWVIKSIERLNFLDRIKLILNSFEFRRSKLDCFYIILIFLIMTKKK